MWKAIVLLGFTLITETPAPRQKLFHGSMPWGCRSLTPEKGKTGVIKLKTQFRGGQENPGTVRRAGLHFLFFFHHRETSSNSPTLEKRTLPGLFV